MIEGEEVYFTNNIYLKMLIRPTPTLLINEKYLIKNIYLQKLLR